MKICQIVHLCFFFRYCDCAFDVAILFWHFDSVLMGCFENVSSHGILSPMLAQIKKMAQNGFPYQVFPSFPK